MEKLSVYVLSERNSGDCTNHGVTSKRDRFTLFWECKKDEALKYCEENNIEVDSALWLNPRRLWEEYHPFAEPLKKSKGVGPMFGGNFIYTSDSRFPSLYGRMNCAHFPIPVHDRFETQEEYNGLCV